MAIDEVTKFESQDVQRYCVCMLSCTIETALRIASGLKSVESFDLKFRPGAPVARINPCVDVWYVLVVKPCEG